MGRDSYLNGNSELVVVEGTSFELGSHCQVAKGFFCHTQTDNASAFINRVGVCLEKGSVKIGDNVWIGRNVFVKHGITIGNNVVVGANSAVTHDIPNGEIWAGNPARKIK